MKKLLLALKVYQTASLQLREMRLKGYCDVYEEQHRDDSIDKFGTALEEYIDRRIENALEQHINGYMHNNN